MKRITRLAYHHDSLSDLEKEPSYKAKIQVYLDEEFAFSLYQSEIRKYGLSEGMELTKEKYHELLEEVLWKRSRQKVLKLLNRSDKTEAEIRNRLKTEGFPDSITDRTIEWLKVYNYINDRRFTKYYLEGRKERKSLAQIKNTLYRKGIAKEIIEEETENLTENPEAIEKAIQKKTKGAPPESYQERQKLAAYLYRKGFSGEEIRRHLQLFEME